MSGEGQDEETRLHDHESARLPVPDPQLRLGTYRVECPLGVGGMGRVYRATAPDGSAVAIKLLRFVDDAVNETFSARFEHEGDLLETIEHPNVVRLLDRGTNPESGLPYLVFEFLDGQDLAQVQREIPGGRLAVAEAVFVLQRCARGLEALHARGIVHRDLKLGNVFVTPSGEVKLIDLGIATDHVDRGESPSAEVIGTLSYMAPEILEGGEGSPAGDVFSLGNMTYRLLTGVRPFPGTSRKRLLEEIHQGPPRVDTLRPDVPTLFADLVHRMLQPDPSLRPTPHGVISAIERAGLGTRTRRVAREWKLGHRGPDFVDEE